MPQKGRKVAFSGKQKKQQLVAKRQSQKFFPSSRGYHPDDDSSADDDAAPSSAAGLDAVQKINYQVGDAGGAASSSSAHKKGSNANRYALQFYRETDRQLRDMRADAAKPLQRRTATELEVDSAEHFAGYDFPLRPDWSYRMSKQQLDASENRYFTEYVMQLERQHADAGRSLSYFELNLETWRQLWRVLELSDIVLVIVDVRYATLQFPPALFEHVQRRLRKDMILVLNKIDLAPAALVLAWRRYFEQRYAGISIVMFTSFPGYNLRAASGWTRGLQIRRRLGKQRMAIEGAAQVLDACRRIAGAEVDLSSWAAKIEEETRWLDEKLSRRQIGGKSSGGQGDDDDGDDDDDNDDDDDPINRPAAAADASLAFDFEEHERFKDGILTVGCVGLPNVGKSSVLNALMGRKVVSVSKTPGHTKHFQTIYLTPTVRLCDCPGLVFPSAVPRPLQVLLGSYPIAQLRVPHAAVRFLAERLDLERLLDLRREPADRERAWSTVDLCEAWALKRGFLTAKAARPDVSRAANSLLRMALEGQLALCLRPPGYEAAASAADVDGLREVEAIQAFGKMAEAGGAAGGSGQADAGESCSASDSGDESEADDQPAAMQPRVQNAFALLSDQDDD